MIITNEISKATSHVSSGENLFITGRAGTGKSTLLEHLHKKLHSAGRNVAVLAPTGVAAINVGGQTIHSFFQFAPGLLQPEYVNPFKSGYLEDKLRAVQTIIFDEASMIRVDMLDAIDISLKMVRGNSKPFGGIQTIFVGDPYQLPPVVATEEESEYLKSHYQTEYFFSAEAFTAERFPMIELTEVFRQNEPEFKAALEGIRTGKASDEHFDLINSRDVGHKFNWSKPGLVYITLTNKKARTMNMGRINDLPGNPVEYKAMIQGTLNKGEYPNDYVLHLKEGAQVMSLVNRLEYGVANGSLGEVVEMGDDSVLVDFYRTEGPPVSISRHKWDKIAYQTYNGKLRQTVKGTFYQIPLKPAYAVTSHKSQGKTLDQTFVDIQGGIFAPGQLYVALSRVTSLEGLHLKRKIKPSDIKIDKRISYHLKEVFKEI